MLFKLQEVRDVFRFDVKLSCAYFKSANLFLNCHFEKETLTDKKCALAIICILKPFYMYCTLFG